MSVSHLRPKDWRKIMEKSVKYNVSAITEKLELIEAIEQEFTGYQIKKAMIQMAISRFTTVDLGKMEFDSMDGAEFTLAIYDFNDEVKGYIQAGPAEE